MLSRRGFLKSIGGALAAVGLSPYLSDITADEPIIEAVEAVVPQVTAPAQEAVATGIINAGDLVYYVSNDMGASWRKVEHYDQMWDRPIGIALNENTILLNGTTTVTAKIHGS